jgi:hypothetical protein
VKQLEDGAAVAIAVREMLADLLPPSELPTRVTIEYVWTENEYKYSITVLTIRERERYSRRPSLRILKGGRDE